MPVIRCKNGHVVGVLSETELIVQHRGRKVVIAARGDICATITCERCGQSVKINLEEKKYGTRE